MAQKLRQASHRPTASRPEVFMEASAPKSGRAHGLSGACSLDWSDAAGLTPEALLASRRMRRVLMAWYRSFLLLFFSPASQRWQKRHSEPASQHSSRWTNAHGLHFPAAWLAEPLDETPPGPFPRSDSSAPRLPTVALSHLPTGVRWPPRSASAGLASSAARLRWGRNSKTRAR